MLAQGAAALAAKGAQNTTLTETFKPRLFDSNRRLRECILVDHQMAALAAQ